MRRLLDEEEPEKTQPTPEEKAKEKVRNFIKKQKYLNYINQGYTIEQAARNVGIKIQPGLRRRDALKVIEKEIELGT